MLKEGEKWKVKAAGPTTSIREEPYQADVIRRYGVRAVVSTEIADIFTSNALKNGLLPVVVDEETLERLQQHPGETATIDLEACELRAGNHVFRFKVEPFARQCLLDGVDTLGWLLAQVPAIEAYEQGRAA